MHNACNFTAGLAGALRTRARNMSRSLLARARASANHHPSTLTHLTPRPRFSSLTRTVASDTSKESNFFPTWLLLSLLLVAFCLYCQLCLQVGWENKEKREERKESGGWRGEGRGKGERGERKEREEEREERRVERTERNFFCCS